MREIDSKVTADPALSQRRAIVVVPTLNAGSRWDACVEALGAQKLPPERVICVDSSSTDDTVAKARAAGFKVVTIPRSSFNHGGTRQEAVDTFASDSEIEIAVFLTQDAVLAQPTAVSSLLAAFDDPMVAAAYGRQYPHPCAGPIGAHARLHSYPSKTRINSSADIAEIGLKAAFLSNSFSAFRISSLRSIGGFPRDTIMNEDLWASAKLILAGWKIAYCAEAGVYHSHDYRISDEFSRYFDIGVFFARESWIRKRFGPAEGEGLRFVRSELEFLLKTAPWLIPSALLRTIVKYAGYRTGLLESHLSVPTKRALSMHKSFWRS